MEVFDPSNTLFRGKGLAWLIAGAIVLTIATLLIPPGAFPGWRNTVMVALVQICILPWALATWLRGHVGIALGMLTAGVGIMAAIERLLLH